MEYRLNVEISESEVTNCFINSWLKVYCYCSYNLVLWQFNYKYFKKTYRLQLRPSFWPWKWRILRYQLFKRAVKRTRQNCFQLMECNFISGLGGYLEVLQWSGLCQGIIFHPCLRVRDAILYCQQIYLDIMKFWERKDIVDQETLSGGGGVAEDAGDVAAAQEGEHEDHPCEVQP